MALFSDSVSLLMLEIAKEFQFCQDVLITCGLIYAGKITVGFSWSVYKGIQQHLWTKLHPASDLTTTLGKWAVVSGIHNGTGKLFAEELARRGMNIILLDDDKDYLMRVSTEIEQEFGVLIRAMLVSYTDGLIVSEQLEKVVESNDIGILINAHDKTFGSPTFYFRMTRDQIMDIITTNVISTSLLTRLVLPGMIQRDRGIILNVTRLPGLLPTPFLAPYSASKAYTDFLSNALHWEYRETNVQFRTVLHSVTRSDVQISEDNILSYALPSKSSFVRNTVDSLFINQRLTGSWISSIQLWLLEQIPAFVIQFAVYELIDEFYIRRMIPL